MFRKWALALCLTALMAAPAGATTLEQMSLGQLTRASTLVVRARFLGANSLWQSGEIWTVGWFQVLETFKGHPKEGEISVETIGGRVGAVESVVNGVPHFRCGEQVVLFLDLLPRGGYSITAWVEGTFRLRWGRGGRRYLTQDTAAELIYNPVTRKFRPAGVQRMPLSEFRERLRKLTGQKPRREPDSSARAGASGDRR